MEENKENEYERQVRLEEEKKAAALLAIKKRYQKRLMIGLMIFIPFTAFAAFVVYKQKEFEKILKKKNNESVRIDYRSKFLRSKKTLW